MIQLPLEIEEASLVNTSLLSSNHHNHYEQSPLLAVGLNLRLTILPDKPCRPSSVHHEIHTSTTTQYISYGDWYFSLPTGCLGEFEVIRACIEVAPIPSRANYIWVIEIVFAGLDHQDGKPCWACPFRELPREYASSSTTYICNGVNGLASCGILRLWT